VEQERKKDTKVEKRDRRAVWRLLEYLPDCRYILWLSCELFSVVVMAEVVVVVAVSGGESKAQNVAT